MIVRLADGVSGRASNATQNAEEQTSSSYPKLQDVGFDIVLMADFTQPGDISFRLAQEIRHFAAQRKSVGLVQINRPPRHRQIAPEVQTCVRRGLATVLSQSSDNVAEMIVHAPSLLAGQSEVLENLRPGNTTMVCYGRQDFAAGAAKSIGNTSTISWAPVNALVRDMAPRDLKLLSEDWLPHLPDGVETRALRKKGSTVTIGWIVANPDDELPAPPDGVVYERIDVGQGANRLGRDPHNATRSLNRLLDAFSGFAYYPALGEKFIPETLLRSAMARGMPVAIDVKFKPVFGDGPDYCAFTNASDIFRQLADAARSEVAEAPTKPRIVARSIDPGPIRMTPGATSLPHTDKPNRPLLFMPSNGAGLGHVSRLLAIARRLDPAYPVVFATQAQAARVIERFGFMTEYVPSATYIGGDFDAWDAWFQRELSTLLELYDPAAVIYDGNNPSDGLINAVTARRDCGLAWVRRGLWARASSPFLKNARWCDLIIEPGELPGQPDDGVTADLRGQAHVVPPVRLLDEDELLDRNAAARALDLDPHRPAVLIQLGAGANRDNISLIDQLVTQLSAVNGMQIAVAEWINSASGFNFWPGVKYLRGYPLSRYFRAFDFSFAAAGYNTFHEVISLDLPTIFIPNRHPTLDDQGGRAEYAQSHGAAFELNDDDLGDLPELISLMIEPNARGFLLEKSAGLKQQNGAKLAAQLVQQLAGAYA